MQAESFRRDIFMDRRKKIIIATSVIGLSAMLLATPALAKVCGGPFTIDSVSTAIESGGFTPSNSYGTLNIVTVDASGNKKNWSSSGYGALYSPPSDPSGLKIRAVQVQATFRLAMLAYKTGAQVYVLSEDADCLPSTTAPLVVGGRTWVTQLSGLFVREPK